MSELERRSARTSWCESRCRLCVHLFIVNILAEGVKHSLEDLRPPRHDGVLDDTPVPLVASLEQLPILWHTAEETTVGDTTRRHTGNIRYLESQAMRETKDTVDPTVTLMWTRSTCLCSFPAAATENMTRVGRSTLVSSNRIESREKHARQNWIRLSQATTTVDEMRKNEVWLRCTLPEGVQARLFNKKRSAEGSLIVGGCRLSGLSLACAEDVFGDTLDGSRVGVLEFRELRAARGLLRA